MKLIIDIPESEYMEIKRYYDNLPMYSTVEAELYYIAHGTPLPKEHGRLIDADVLVDGMEDDYELCELVNSTPTIIESERGE